MPNRFLAGAMPTPQMRASERVPDPTFLGAVGAGFRTALDEQGVAQSWRLRQAYDPVVDALVEQGIDRRTLVKNAGISPAGALFAAALDGAPANIDRDAVWKAVAAARARDPKAFADLTDRDAFERKVLTRDGARRGDQATADRGGLAARLIGGAGASFADPINVLTLPLGGGKTIAQTVLREAIVNAGVEAVETPILAGSLSRLGEELTPTQAAINIGAAGLAGGALGGAGKAVELHGGTAVRAAGDRLATAREAGIERVWDRLPAAVRQRWAAASDIGDGDLPELAELAIGRDAMSEDVRTAVDVVRREDAVARTNPFLSNGAGVAAHQDNLATALARILNDADAPAPARVTPAPPPPVVSPRARLSAGTAMASYMRATRSAESGGNDAIGAATSSAFGRYQFTQGTWLHYYKQEFGRGGLSDAAILAKRSDGALQDRLMQALTADNAASLRRAGQEVSAGNLYLLHFAGPSDGVRILAAAPDTPVAAIMRPRSVAANPWVRGLTVSDLRARLGRKVGDASVPDVSIARGAADDAPAQDLIQADLARLSDERTALIPEAIEQPSIGDTLAAGVEAASPVVIDAVDLPPIRTSEIEPATRIDDLTVDGSGRVDAIEQANMADASIVAAPDPAQRPRAARERAPEDALTYLARRGGLRDDEGHDLRGRGRLVSGAVTGQKRRAGGGGERLPRFAPGGGHLFKKNGMTIDEAGELLNEAGFMRGERPTTAQVLDYLEGAATNRQYRLEDDAVVAERARAAEERAWLDETQPMLDDIAEATGEALSDAEIAGIRRYMGDGYSAWEGWAMHVEDEALARSGDFSPATNDLDYDIPFEEVMPRDRSAPRSDPRDAQGVDRRSPDGDGPAGGDRIAAQAGTGGEAGHPSDTLTRASAGSFDDPDGAAARAAVDSMEHDARMALDRGAATDPGVAARQRQEAALKAASPMQARVDQDGTIGMGLFDAVDQAGLRLSDDGPEQSLGDLLRGLDDEQAAIDAVRSCL